MEDQWIFVWASYAVCGLVLLGLIVETVVRHRAAMRAAPPATERR